LALERPSAGRNLSILVFRTNNEPNKGCVGNSALSGTGGHATKPAGTGERGGLLPGD
jgi:hypothetical protein